MIKLTPVLLFLLCFLTGVQKSSAEDLLIPALVGQTEASATFGKNETDAYTLAVEEWNARGGVNGRQVVLRIEDIQTSQRQTISGFQRLALTKPPVILGPTWLDGFQGVIPLAQKKDILLVTPSAAREAFSDENKDWPITFYHNSRTEIETLITDLKQRGYSRIALIYEQEPFAEMIWKLVTQNDVKLVAEFGVPAGQVDFQSLLTKLKTNKPDVLIVFVWDERSLLSLLQQLKVHLATLQLATMHDGEGWIKDPVFQGVLSRLIFTKFIVADSSFDKKFKARFGYEPILTATNAYDAINSVLSARASGCNTGKDIREYLLTHELDTVTFGKFRFRADGSVPSVVKVVEYAQERSPEPHAH